MRRIVNTVLIAGFLLASVSLLAQKSKKEGENGQQSAKNGMLHTCLGRSDIRGGNISKLVFDSLLKQGIIAKDSAGTVYKVERFVFNYGERNLYEDSVGNLMVLTDYIVEVCPGDTISLPLKNNIFYKTKPGDTAFIDNVRVHGPNGETGAKGMIFYLTK